MRSNNTHRASAPAIDYHKELIDALYDAGITANNLADLISFLARTAKDHAYEAGDDEFHFKFHELGMALKGAEMLKRKNAEVIDRLSFRILREQEAES